MLIVPLLPNQYRIKEGLKGTPYSPYIPKHINENLVS